MILNEAHVQTGTGIAVTVKIATPGQVSGDATPTAVICHGAGGDLDHPLVEAMANGLCASGYTTIRFNFDYRQRGEDRPDPMATRQQTLNAVIQESVVRGSQSRGPIVLIGKSMGAQTAVAFGASNPGLCDALVCLGYPIHRSSDPGSARFNALPQINVPVLFVTGTRDPLCDIDTLKRLLSSTSADWSVLPVEGGDHSYRMSAESTMSRAEVLGRIVVATRDWLATVLSRA